MPLNRRNLLLEIGGSDGTMTGVVGLIHGEIPEENRRKNLTDTVRVNTLLADMKQVTGNRQRILEVSLRMFNEQGSHAVSTNQIATEAGISVGNLYYHFKNKEEIVAELFEEVNRAWESRLVVPDPAAPKPEDIEALVREHFKILWEFRFFYREQTALRQNDAKLARRWSEVHRRGRADMAGLLRGVLVQRGAGEPDAAWIEETTDACWIVADYWMPFAESRGTRLRQADLERGLSLFRRVMYAMLRPDEETR